MNIGGLREKIRVKQLQTPHLISRSRETHFVTARKNHERRIVDSHVYEVKSSISIHVKEGAAIL